MNFSTKVVRIGGDPDKSTGAIAAPIYQTSTYTQVGPGEASYEYSRSHNPTRDRLEQCLASLENARHALVVSTGMAASTLVAHLLPKGSRILCSDDVYGGTYRLLTTIFKDTHRTLFRDTTKIRPMAQHLQEFRPNLVWLESPSNPLLKISPIEEICEISKKWGAKVLVDNTFMSPYFQNPLDLGADFVLHSMTKYLGGHSDALGGCLMLNDREDYEKLWTLQNSMGPTHSPFESWLVLRGIKTLALRMKAHEAGAAKVVAFLEKHKAVEKVLYPGLPSHPGHGLAKEQMRGFGGMVSFYLKGNFTEVKRFFQRLKLIFLAESLGGVESLANHPATMTHAAVERKHRDSLGITDNLIRLSVGIEDGDDLVEDIREALQTPYIS